MRSMYVRWRDFRAGRSSWSSGGGGLGIKGAANGTCLGRRSVAEVPLDKTSWRKGEGGCGRRWRRSPDSAGTALGKWPVLCHGWCLKSEKPRRPVACGWNCSGLNSNNGNGEARHYESHSDERSKGGDKGLDLKPSREPEGPGSRLGGSGQGHHAACRPVSSHHCRS